MRVACTFMRGVSKAAEKRSRRKSRSTGPDISRRQATATRTPTHMANVIRRRLTTRKVLVTKALYFRVLDDAGPPALPQGMKAKKC
jgi:hypothetical protein